MKKTFTTIALVLAAVGVAAQDNRATCIESSGSSVEIKPVEGKPGTMSIRVAGYELLVEQDGERSCDETTGSMPVTRGHGYKHGHRSKNSYGGHIGPLEIGFGGFRATPGAYSANPATEAGFMDLSMGKSIHIAVNVLTVSEALTRGNTLGVTAGVGLAMSNFTFETPSAFVKTGNMIHPVDAGHALKKAKLNTFALHFPLALEVNPTRDFFFSVGGYADLMLSSHMKWKSPKEKLHAPYTNFLQAGLSARVGFRNVYAFANYGLVNMFRGGKGPVVNPYTFGLGLGF